MESSNFNWVLKHVPIVLLVLTFFLNSSTYATPSSSSSLLDLVVANTTTMHRNFTAVSNFRLINRRILKDCSASSPFVQVNVTSTTNSSLSDEEFVTVTVTGVSKPSDGDWVAMISPSNSK